MKSSPAAIADIFVQDDMFTAWMEHLDAIGPPPFPVAIPGGADLLEALRVLAIPEQDIDNVVRLVPDPDEEPDLWWLIERTVHSFARTMGSVDGPPRFAALQDWEHPRYRFFHVHLLLAALPQLLTYVRRRGIPEDIVNATLADVGRNIDVHRKRTGEPGLGTAWWLMLHLRGMIYQLGRLQFELARLGNDGAVALGRAGIDADADSVVLSIHIPDFLGPMTPEASDDSIFQAHQFFATHYPDVQIVAGTCNSWLLDPSLKTYLHPESNIIRFQQRFALLDGGWETNTGILQFVFGTVPNDLDDLPQRSSLERAVVTHLKAGNDWMGRRGWFRW